MTDDNFNKNASRYRLTRTNSSSEFPKENCYEGFHHHYQRRPNFIRETSLTPDSCHNTFLRVYDQDQFSHMNQWNFPNYNDKRLCKCSTSTPRIHQTAADSDPRHDVVYLRSPNSSIPPYFSLKTNASKKKSDKCFGESKTLGRPKIKDHNSGSLTSGWVLDRSNENIKNYQSEHCLNWLEDNNDFRSLEGHMKELDTNIELLKWKKKHLESIQQQKLNSMHRGAEVLTGNQLDSPPPLCDLVKPDLSVDDGFESVADTCNNSVQHISDLETELRKQQLKVKLYEAMLGKSKLQVEMLKGDFKKQENKYQTEIEKLRSTSERKSMHRSSPEVNVDKTPLVETCSSAPNQMKPRAARPKSFKRELFPHSNQELIKSPSDVQNCEFLSLKAELLIKDQHLKKLRVTLKELSVRHNELLDLHMLLVKNQTKSETNMTNESNKFILDLSDVVEDLQRIFNTIGRNRSPTESSTSSPASTPSGNELVKLQQSVERLKVEVQKKYGNNKAPPQKVKQSIADKNRDDK